ncbi:family 78 glycoside hydrolase catalytic domain [Pontiellaceae bacterium B12227]|nr:family 78 glycoside hydrolase catalytic domain [Pontiellaceae bacterium B12227]
MKNSSASVLKSITLLLMCAVNALASSGVSVADLKVEHLRNPIQLDMQQPRLSWKIRATDPQVHKIKQQSYRILVADSPQKLSNDEGNLWDSGVVASDQSILIPYLGKKLQSRQACYWKVQVTDNKGGKSDWSETAFWEMALLSSNDWKESEWIGLKKDTRDSPFTSRKPNGKDVLHRSNPSPLLRKEISIAKAVKKARAYVSGIGYSEFYINGNKISDHVLDPGQTNYDKHTLYVVHDITDDLKPGTNALGFWLGNGFYGQNLAFNPKFEYGKPKLRAKLFVEYTDGSSETFATDTSWKATVSPILFDNAYWGESYDARLEIPGWSKPGRDDSNWQQAVNVKAPCPDNKLRPQLLPPIKEMERFKPVSNKKVDDDTYQVDFGKNFSGWYDIKLNQNPGDIIRFYPTEVLDRKTGRGNQKTRGGAPGAPEDHFYICKGNGPESYSPRFVYSGFQYLEITGLAEAPTAETIEAVFVRSAIEKTGSFESSNEMFNKQYAASLLSLEGNWHSLPEDCPAREKCGWLGDAHATADLSLYNYDMARFYSKYNRDIQDSLNADHTVRKVIPGSAGIPPMVAPGRRSNRVGTIDWAVAYVIIPWRMYVHTGDAEAFRPHYEHFKDFITYYKSFKNKDGVIDNGLGDWCPPNWDRKAAPEFMECHPFVSGTAFYFQALELISKMALLMDDADYSKWCLKEAADIQKAFDQVYLKPVEGSKGLKHYGSQTATVMALKLGMVPDDQIEDRVEALLFDINERHNGHHACGIHGLRHLYTVLADNGHGDLAYKMLTDTTFPGPGFIMDLGLSTWPERRFDWNKVEFKNSFNHPMNGGFVAFMHESLGGIRPDEQSVGYKHFQIKPQLTDQVEWVKSHVESPYGEIRSEWKNEGETFEWFVEVPPNTTATLYVPYHQGRELSEGEHRGLQKKLTPIAEGQQKWLKSEVGSGVYHFNYK